MVYSSVGVERAFQKSTNGIEPLSWSGSLKVDRVPEVLVTLYKPRLRLQKALFGDGHEHASG